MISREMTFTQTDSSTIGLPGSERISEMLCRKEKQLLIRNFTRLLFSAQTMESHQRHCLIP